MKNTFKLSDLDQYKDEVGAPFGHSDDVILPGNGLTLTELKTLYGLIRHFKPRCIVEAGTHRGNSTWYMKEAVVKNGFGHIFTIDKKQLQDCRITGDPHVTVIEEDILEWLKINQAVMSWCDFFNHDDYHGIDHIINEIEMVGQYQPKIITVHDSLTESKPYWDGVMKKKKEYLTNYSRYEVISLMGQGILIRND